MSPMAYMVAYMEVDKLADMKVDNVDDFWLICNLYYGVIPAHVMCLEVYWSSVWIKRQLDF